MRGIHTVFRCRRNQCVDSRTMNDATFDQEHRERHQIEAREETEVFEKSDELLFTDRCQASAENCFHLSAPLRKRRGLYL